MIFLDACIVIYLVEANESFSGRIAAAMRAAGPTQFCVNDLVRLECLVGPLRSDNPVLADTFRRQFAALRMLEMNREVFDLAAELRAHEGLKTPDALHVATAIRHGCTAFWTGDARLTAIGDRVRVQVFGSAP